MSKIDKLLTLEISGRGKFVGNSVVELCNSSVDSFIKLYEEVSRKKSGFQFFGNFEQLPDRLKEKFTTNNYFPSYKLGKYHDVLSVEDSLVLSSEGKILTDSVLNNRYGNVFGVSFVEKKISYMAECREESVLDFPVYYLPGNGLMSAYTHWFTETLTRLEAWFAFSHPRPKLMFDSGLNNYQREMLSMLGVSMSDIFERKRRAVYRIGVIYISSAAGLVNFHDAGMMIFSRLKAGFDDQYVSSNYKNVPEKIKIIRKDKSKIRSLINLEDLLQVPELEDFFPIAPEDMNIHEKVHVFSKAKYIVSEAGGGLTNIVFSPPGCRVLIASSDAFPSPIFTNISAYTSAKIGYVVGTSVENKMDKHDNNSNFVISKSEFRRACAGIFGDSVVS